MNETTCQQLDLSNIIIMGYMIGTYNTVGKGGAQAVAN